MANTKLPLGLTRYAGNRFDALHNAGCMCLTASSVPDLFGMGRHGRLALAAHVMGVMPIESPDTDLTRRGKMMQETVVKWFEEETGIRSRCIHAWAKDEHLDFYASPDSLSFPYGPGHKWVGGKNEALPGEIKVVAHQIYDEDWQGGPPQKVLLQHQAQLRLTNSKAGPVIAAAIGDFAWDLGHWMVEAHQQTQDIIMDEVADFLSLVQAGQLPPPDLTLEKDQEALIRLATVDEGRTIEMPDELLYYVRRYQKAGVIAKQAEKWRKEAKAHLMHTLDGAQLGVFSDGQTVKLNQIHYQEQHRNAYTAIRMNIGRRKEGKKAA